MSATGEHGPLDRGPRSRFQIIWKSGHVEEIEAHQVSYPDNMHRIFGEPQAPDQPDRVHFHGEFDGRWQLVLTADQNAIESIRNLSVCGEGL